MKYVFAAVVSSGCVVNGSNAMAAVCVHVCSLCIPLGILV